MRLKIDTDSDAIYLYVTTTKIDNTKRVRPGENHDFDSDGQLVGVEIIDASKRFGDIRKLTLDAVVADLHLKELAAA